MGDNNLWYTRRNKVIRGPFPAGMITRHILLGRILESDQLSSNQQDWKLVEEHPELIPEEMKLDLSIAENSERLSIAKLREDERQHGDRRELEDARQRKVNIAKRSGIERRSTESNQTLRHRELKTEFRQSIKTVPRNYASRISLLVIFVASVLFLSITGTPNRSVSINFCQAPAAPYVNWNNCFLEGINLVKQNLTGASLVNGQFTGADMRGSILQGAKLSYSNLANSRMQNTNLKNAIMIGAILRNGNLVGADFSNANLSYAVFQGANLTNANFTNANLTHVVFNNSIINNAIFSGAILDKAIWTDNSVCAPESIGRCVNFTKE
jgi:hypothetical protein